MTIADGPFVEYWVATQPVSPAGHCAETERMTAACLP